ncbi:MAG: hypothetical protein KGI54_13175 [Pseudomonadota bacterium]|nr:hypothetical protein [Pseudomonadota bacterium]
MLRDYESNDYDWQEEQAEWKRCQDESDLDLFDDEPEFIRCARCNSMTDYIGGPFCENCEFAGYDRDESDFEDTDGYTWEGEDQDYGPDW